MILVDIFLVIWAVVILFYLIAYSIGLIVSPFALIYKSIWNDDPFDKKDKRKLLFSVLFFIFSVLLLFLVLSID